MAMLFYTFGKRVDRSLFPECFSQPFANGFGILTQVGDTEPVYLPRYCFMDPFKIKLRL